MRNSNEAQLRSWELPAWKDFWELGKPRVVLVMLVCALVGMALATPALPALEKVVLGLVGIGLASMGAAAFNHLLDRRLDKLMLRTSSRPLAEGRLGNWQAGTYAALLSVAGVSLLWYTVNPLTAWLTLGSLIGYALIYTGFLKRVTPQNITIGGLAGAAPPLLGWTAITGELHPNALLLVLIIFAWTPPHFWALAIYKQEEYAKAGVPMLPVTHGEAFARLQVWLYTWLTVAVTLLPFVTGMSGWIYLAGVLALNVRFLFWNWKVWRGKDLATPLASFWFSIRYILLLFLLLLVDHYASLVI